MNILITALIIVMSALLFASRNRNDGNEGGLRAI